MLRMASRCLKIKGNEMALNRSHPSYLRWKNMRQRCNNKNSPGYEYFGDRGIKICKEFDNFDYYANYIDSLPNANKEGFNVHRIDNDVGYALGNLIWVKKVDKCNALVEVTNRKINRKTKGNEMAFDKITAEETGSTGFVKSNGVHKVELIRVGLSTRNNGSKGLSLVVKSEASEYADILYDFGDTNYAATYTKADGTKAKMAPRFVNSIATFVGAEDDSTMMITVDGKDGPKEVEVFSELNDTGVIIQVAVQMQYNDYYKEMKPTVVAVFNEDGFSATEVNKGASEPKQIKLYDNIQDKGGDSTPAKTEDKVPTPEQEADDVF